MSLASSYLFNNCNISYCYYYGRLFLGKAELLWHRCIKFSYIWLDYFQINNANSKTYKYNLQKA